MSSKYVVKDSSNMQQQITRDNLREIIDLKCKKNNYFIFLNCDSEILNAVPCLTPPGKES